MARNPFRGSPFLLLLIIALVFVASCNGDSDDPDNSLDDDADDDDDDSDNDDDDDDDDAGGDDDDDDDDQDRECERDADCDDGLYCNGQEICIRTTGQCWPSDDVVCPDDSFFCNGDEVCDEEMDTCGHTGSPCTDDGVFCNGPETCIEYDDSCWHGGNPCYSDGLYCNGTEYCDEDVDVCDNTGDPCEDDGEFCNGTEYCDEYGDVCESTGFPCDDGEFCNGAESCDEEADACGPAARDACPTGTDCDEFRDECAAWPAIEKIEGGYVGEGESALAVAANGTRRIATRDTSDLHLYSSGDGVVWTDELVDPHARVPNIKLDAAGNVHVAYFDMRTDDLKYATNASGGWAIETIAENAYRLEWINHRPGLAIDASGAAHVVARRVDGYGIAYMTNAEGAWTIEALGSDFAHVADLALDSQGEPRVLLSEMDSNYSGLAVVSRVDGTWTPDVIYEDNVTFTDGRIVVDSGDVTHVVFSYYDNVTSDDWFYYARRDATDWSFLLTDYGPGGNGSFDEMSLDTNAGDVPYVAYNNWWHYKGGHTDIQCDFHCLYRGEVYWEDFVSDDECWTSATFDLDGSGVGHFTRFDEGLQYWTTEDAEGDFTTVGGGFEAGSAAVAVLDGDGNVHVAHAADADHGLRYATNAGGDWTAEMAVDAGEYSTYHSLALDADGRPRISYVNYADGGVRLASRIDGTWINEPVDEPDAYAARYTAMAADPEGGLHIVYRDGSTKSLMYATNSGGDWAVETLVAERNAATRDAIAVDAAGIVHVAYDGGYSETGLRYLGYARNDGSGWTFEVADAYATYGTYLAIDVDAGGFAHIALGSTVTRYATNASGAWVVEDVFTFGTPPSIAVDGDGRPWITSGLDRSLRGMWLLGRADDGSWAAVDVFPGPVDAPNGYSETFTPIRIDVAGIAHVVFPAFDAIFHAALPLPELDESR